MNKTVGFIGSGRVTRFMLTGWQKAGKLPQTVVVSDANVDVLNNLKAQFPDIRIAPNDNAQPAACDIIFLALHPPVIKDVLTQVKAQITPNTLFISLAPKLSIKALSDILGGFQRIARVIPNAPSVGNRGYNPVALSPSLTAAEQNDLFDLLCALGECPEVPEEHLEAYAILTAMGPTYLWFQLYELIELGKSFGLAAKDVEIGIANMVRGAIATMLESGLNPAQVMDLVPVKPLGEDEATIKNIYRTKLEALFKKLKS
jgi:pyrroline-5-carboxylate reductase